MIRRAAILFLLALAAPARADEPPPPDSPDAHCTLDEQCPHGTFCPYAFRPGAATDAGAPPVGEACRTAAKGKGLEARCQHGGIYAGDQLFCPAGEHGSWTPPAPSATGVGSGSTLPGSKACTCATPSGPADAWAGLALVAFAATGGHRIMRGRRS